MIPRRPAVATLALPLVALALLACGRAHDLGVGDATSTGAGVGGAGGAGATSTGATSTSSGATTSTGASASSSAGGGEGGTGGDASSSSGSSSSSSTGGIEPAGPTKLTILDAINDYDAIRVCFLPYPAGDPNAKPWPDSASGLAFARAAVVDSIDAIIPPNTDVQPQLFAGDLAATAGKTCGELLAMAAGNGAPIVASAMPVIPANVWTAQKSLLFAPLGCMGGPGHDSPSASLACGNGYYSAAPTATLALVAMSRITKATAVSLQAVQAAIAMPPVDVRIVPGFQGSVEQEIATQLAVGGIGPKPPFAGLTFAELGALPSALIETYPMGYMSPASTTTFADAFANGTVTAADVADGANYVLVASGSYPGLGAGPFWHQLTWTMLRADP